METGNSFYFLLLKYAAYATALAAGAFAGVGLYESVLGNFLAEVRDESAGGVRGAGSVVVRKLGAFSRRFMRPSYELRVRRQLIRAGEPYAYKPEDIFALQMLGFVGGLLLGFIGVVALDLDAVWAVVFGLALAFYPLLWLSDQVKRRHLLITRALPYNLDLLTLSVEAGLDFPAALSKVVEKGKPGPLRDEFQLVLKQLKMGKTREEVLKAMIVRIDLPPLTTFITALIQADKMGTSLGKVLRIQATQLRIDRTQRAEKLAAEAPVKMLLPLLLFIFPTVFLVLFGPIFFAYLTGQVGM